MSIPKGVTTGEDDPRSDAELLGAVAGGDQAAFRVLHDRLAPWLRVCLSRRSAGAGVIDDVVQETFVAVWKKPDRWRGDGEVAAWIWRIAMHKLTDEQHPRSKIRAATQLMAQALDVRRHVEPSAEEEMLVRSLRYGEFGDAFRKLSPELRDVVQARWLDGLTTNEAARALGTPPGTVKTRLMRARIKLREELGRSFEKSPLG